METFCRPVEPVEQKHLVTGVPTCRDVGAIVKKGERRHHLPNIPLLTVFQYRQISSIYQSRQLRIEKKVGVVA